MSFIQAILLGVLQGVTEFLPVSSSGHLAIVQALFGLENVPLLFDVMLHLATLVAVVLFFRRRIAVLCGALGRFIVRRPRSGDGPLQKMIVAVICGTVVTGVFGLFLNGIVGDFPLKLVCVFFIVTGCMLVFSSYYRPKRIVSEPGAKQGLLVGLAQGFGVLPGISRSGITISASLVCGIDRASAGEFSFLLSIPAILGAFILEAKDMTGLLNTVQPGILAAGCAAAFVSGLLSLKLLMKVVSGGKLAWFACYLIPAGILGIIFL